LIMPYEANRKLIISRDVTDRERVETMRRDFVANVSHELRTPLTVIGGFLETIADMETPDPALIRHSVPMMSDQAKRMQTLVEDLLTLSRLESSGHPVRDDPVNVPDIARALYHDALALSAGRHKVTLLLESEAWVSGAEDELRSAFGNLVSNAVRYTPPGGEISLSWKDAGDGAVFAVRDTGIGIAPDHLPRLTERFYRVDRGRSRETGGTGLGLAIVKHVVNRHAAKLEVSSETGRGSCFSVVFPESQVVARPAHADARSA
jgi:two-component system phosphate regulon sensor histidine kinase PhoR